MHLLQLSERLELGPKDTVIPGEYITDDLTAAHLMMLAGGGTMTPLLETRMMSLNDANIAHIRYGRSEIFKKPLVSILFARMGGFGDLILLTPILRHLKQTHPHIKIGVSTMGHYAVALANLPYVDEILPYPLPKEVAEKYDAWVWYENAIEKNPKAETVHMTDLFAEIAGVPWPDDADKCPDYKVKPSEAIWANEAYPRQEGVKRVCIQIGTSALCRTYPRGTSERNPQPNNMGAVAAELLKRGYEVFLLGSKGEINTPDQNPPNFKNLSNADLTFRQGCAVLATADCMIGSDSALVHVAGALRIPAVGLYGPFPWKLRTAYAPTTHAIQGNGACSPCFHHASPVKKNHFPDNCPSKAKGTCEVLASIEPKRIVSQVEKQIEAFPRASATPFQLLEGGKE